VRLSGKIVVVISAQTEWKRVKDALKPGTLAAIPYGESFEHIVEGEALTFFHGGWGKIDAAASSQFIISEWSPVLLINLGTCGGIKGRVQKGEVFLIERTIVYDIFERIADAEEAIRHYQTEIDLSWIGKSVPAGVSRATILSADRDILPQDVAELVRKYDAKIVDWESASIARVCRLNRVPCLILRGVSDLVDARGGEAYEGNMAAYQAGTESIMPRLLEALPEWVKLFRHKNG